MGYTWKTYKLRFPYRHTWQVETQWKKLPLAPKSVHKVPSKPSMLQDTSGSKLVNEQNQELKWVIDEKGYYYWGEDPPTEEEKFRRQKPHKWELWQKKREEEEEASALQLQLYPNMTDDMQYVQELL